MERHRFDLVSFVFGAIFAAVALIGLTDLVWLRPIDLRWLAPGILVLLGLLLVVTSGRSRNGAADDVDDVSTSGAEPAGRAPDPRDDVPADADR